VLTLKCVRSDSPCLRFQALHRLISGDKGSSQACGSRTLRWLNTLAVPTARSLYGKPKRFNVLPFCHVTLYCSTLPTSSNDFPVSTEPRRRLLLVHDLREDGYLSLLDIRSRVNFSSKTVAERRTKALTRARSCSDASPLTLFGQSLSGRAGAVRWWRTAVGVMCGDRKTLQTADRQLVSSVCILD
jgi:hypothetical protein